MSVGLAVMHPELGWAPHLQLCGFWQITHPLWALTPSLKMRLKLPPSPHPALWELGTNVPYRREAPCPGEPTTPPGSRVGEQTGLGLWSLGLQLRLSGVFGR